MSWFSNFIHGVVDAVTGKATPGPIINNPTTPIEAAVNTAGQATTEAVSASTAAVRSEAASTVQSFLTNSVGGVGAQIADAALEVLAASALSKMSSSSNKTEEEIADILGAAVQTIAGTPATA